MPDNPIKLLVIDDEDSIVDYTLKIFKNRGYEVFGAKKGDEALEVFNKERPNILLIDVFLVDSDIDGMEILKKVKEMDQEAICIMQTRVTDQSKIEEAKALGALDYLLKPFEVAKLIEAVEKAADIIKKKGENG